MNCNKVETVVQQYNFMTGIIRGSIINKLERCPKCGAPLDLMELNTNKCNVVEYAKLMLFCRNEMDCGYLKTVDIDLITYLDNRGFSKDYKKLLVAMLRIYNDTPRALKKKYLGCEKVVEAAPLIPIPKKDAKRID